ncbi:alpha/beta fold hydrolase [Undibacterium sp. Di24W]|uniref:alpha/beta fold hydrolase n=1 Tax=Undibacterium sp. Di24W TaxID=3413033 RepID=UPI003BF03068
MKSLSFCNTKPSTKRIHFAVLIALICALSSNTAKASTSNEALSGKVTTSVTTGTNNTTKAASAVEYQVGSMYVEEYLNPNAKGAPIILIPGLSSGGYIWDDTVKALRNEHNLYVITLAGFNGKPAIAGPKIAKAKQSLLELITSKQIDKPILVGHSLGALLSTWFAVENSARIRGVFAVDGLPVFPRTENMPAAQRPAMAQAAKTQMANVTQAIFAEQQLQYMRTMGVVEEKNAQTLAELSSKSDRVAVAEYMGELLEADIRQDLPKISVPVTFISPYYAPDFTPVNISEDAKHAYYGTLLKGIPQLTMVGISNSRHFPMVDQPQIFADKLAQFIKSLP